MHGIPYSGAHWSCIVRFNEPPGSEILFSFAIDVFELSSSYVLLSKAFGKTMLMTICIFYVESHHCRRFTKRMFGHMVTFQHSLNELVPLLTDFSSHDDTP